MSKHLLFTALKEENSVDELTAISLNQWREVVQLANEHYVAPRLCAQLKKKNVSLPVEVERPLKQSLLLNSGRNMTIYAAFSNLCLALQSANIPVIPLKGAYLAQAIYPQIGERVIGDIDLMVSKNRIAEAIQIGIDLNFHPTKPIVLEAWLENKYQACPQYNAQIKLTLEWHWHIASPATLIPLESLWQQAETAVLANQPILALTPEHHILHLAHHLSYHHDFLFGLRNLIDLDLLCRQNKTTVNWQKLIQQSKAWRIERGVYMALLLCQTHLATPIPMPVLQALEPDTFKPQYLKLATQQLCTPPAHYGKISLTRRRIADAMGWWNKVHALQTAVFPSRTTMAMRYGTATSISFPKRTLIRWRSLLNQAVVKIVDSDLEKTAVSQMLKRKKKLTVWLREEQF